MEIVYQKIQYLQEKLRAADILRNMDPILHYPFQLLARIKVLGSASELGEYEKRKLGVFNQLNFFQLLTGTLIPIIGMLHADRLPFSAWVIACLPALTSLVVLFMNYKRRYETALLTYFIAYPFFTCIVYLNGMNSGMELHFILFGILSVFFLQDIGYMLFTVAFSMVSYFILSVVLKDFIYQVEFENKVLYLCNQAIAIVFIFYGLYLVKKENTEYQFRLIKQNRALHKKNLEISKQKQIIAHKAKLLQTQKKELTQLDALKDLNYTIGLMENLLQWSKSQMQAESVRAQEIDLSQLINEVIKVLHLQAE